MIRTRIILTLLSAGQRLHVALMPPLANLRWEKFAQLIACGETGAAAYRTTYDARGASADANASRLLRNDKVRQRVAKLQAASATSTMLTMQERRERLAAAARRDNIRVSDLVSVLLADAKLAGELVQRAVQAVDERRLLSPERRRELIKLSMERRAMNNALGPC